MPSTDTYDIHVYMLLAKLALVDMQDDILELDPQKIGRASCRIFSCQNGGVSTYLYKFGYHWEVTHIAHFFFRHCM